VRRILFVGPEEKTLIEAGFSIDYVKEFCKKLMLKELGRGPYIFLSGRCPKKGIDVICEEIADELGLQKEIFVPEVNQWNDKKYYETTCRSSESDMEGCFRQKKYWKGYRSRNIDMAKTCDICYDIEPKGSCRHCGGRGKWLEGLMPCLYCKGTGIYSGGTFTYKKALEFGKEAYQIILGKDSIEVSDWFEKWFGKKNE